LKDKYEKYTDELRRLKEKIDGEGRHPTSSESKRASYLLDLLDGLDDGVAVAGGNENWAVIPNPGIEQRSSRNARYSGMRPFKTLGEQMQCIARAGTPGGEIDNRLHEVRAATGLSEGIGGDGGFLIQPDYSSDILEKSYMTGEIIRRCYHHPMKSNQSKLPAVDETSRATGSRHGDVRAYWTAEAATKTASQPKFMRIELNANKAVVLIYATDELLEDAQALDAYIRRVAPQEINFLVEDGIINGTGAGRPLGVNNANCLVVGDKEVGQAGGTFLYENALEMWSRMYGPSRKNAVWLINQDVEPQLYSMSLAVGAGGSSVFMPGGGASVAPYATLFGRPVIPVEYCETLGTQGDVILGDFSQYVLAQKGGVQFDMSIHVAFLSDQSVFRFVLNVDGQPWWSNALTPLKGASNTQSPFVVIEDRS